MAVEKIILKFDIKTNALSYRVIIWIFFLALILLPMASCKKYLDKKSANNLVIPSTLDDVQALLDYDQPMNRTTPSLMETCSDDYYLVTLPSSSALQQAYTWQPFNYGLGNDWADNYNAIYYANLALELIEKVPISSTNETQWHSVKGSALFIRAYSFLNLAWAFAKAFDENTANLDLGIVLKLESDFNKTMIRSSVAETYDQILKDTRSAMTYLPDNPQITTRPSKAAAYGLMARTFLSTRQYDSALKYSDLSLGIKGQLMDYNSNLVNPSNTIPFPDFSINPEIIFFQRMTANHVAFTSSAGIVDTLLFLSFDNNDLRKSAYFRPVNTAMPNAKFQRYKGSYTANTISFTGISTDEMYLTRAECYARLGDKNTALDNLNALLTMRWKSGTFTKITATTADQVLDIILLERRKELLLRGLRWMDIKRLNKEGRNITLKRIIGGHTYLLQPNSNYYALPLPFDIVNNSQILQNPL